MVEYRLCVTPLRGVTITSFAILVANADVGCRSVEIPRRDYIGNREK
jgi:hypothetical protein